MRRYIDEISARENFQDVLAYMGSEVKRILKKVPTADVVEVVRCKDCMWFTDADETFGTCGLNKYDCYSDHYCSYGKRREG